MTSHAYLDAPPLALAHRGGGEPGLENTLAAFQDAVDLGFRYLETDVHATSDGHLVAFHDDVLDRVTDRQGAIGAMTWDEVARARIAGAEAVPHIDDVLAAFPDTRINIDVKSDAAVAPVIRLLGRAGLAERLCIGSFDDRRLSAIREARPDVCRSAGPREVVRLKLRSRARSLDRLLPVDADCVQVPVRQGRLTVVDERFIATCHEAGLQVHVWTINDAEEMRRLLDLGVDGIVSDDTRTLRDVLVARDQWEGRSST